MMYFNLVNVVGYSLEPAIQNHEENFSFVESNNQFSKTAILWHGKGPVSFLLRRVEDVITRNHKGFFKENPCMEVMLLYTTEKFS